MSNIPFRGEPGPIAWMACNPNAANILLILVMVAGYFALDGLTKEVFPSYPTSTFTVMVPYPGSSPEEVEQGILIKIEEELQDLVGVKEMRSEAREGIGVVTVQMDVNADFSSALNQAKVRIDGIASFPTDAEEPIIEEVITTTPAMRVSIFGDVDEVVLKQMVEQVREEILALGDISEISVLGDRQYEISIEVSDAELRRYGLDFDQVTNSIRQRSQDLPGGQLRTADGIITLRSVSQAYAGTEYAELALLALDDGTRINLGDIAVIRDRFEEQPVLSRFNGEPAITLEIERVGNQDVLDITEQIRAYIALKQPTLADKVHIVGWNDASNILRARIDLLLKNAVQGALLVILALALFLDLSLALWVIVGVPFAILGTLATVYFFSLPVSINVLSVFAFILVLGILVDDGVVTAESAYAKLENERDGIHSIVAGVRRVATATIFGALTTAIAFAPTLFITEGFARIMGQVGMVVMLCVVFSLIETKLILPAHLRHVRIRDGAQGKDFWIRRLQRHFSLGIGRFAQGPYSRLLERCLEYRYVTLSIFVSVLILCLSTVPAKWVRLVFFPDVPSDYINIDLDMPEGTPWHLTHQFARRIEQAANMMDKRFQVQDPQSRRVIRHILVRSENDASAHIDIQLIPSEDRDISSVELAQWLRESLPVMEGVRAFSVDANAGPGGPAVDVELRGQHLDELRRAAEEVKMAVSTINGIRDVRDSFKAGSRELNILATPEGEALGIGDVELARQVRQAFFGAEIQRIQRGREEVRVYVRFPEADRHSTDSLKSMWIRLPDGRKVPFSVVGEVHERSGFGVISRFDRQRVVNVQADIDKSILEPGAAADLLERQILPQILVNYPRVDFRLTGEAEDEQETNQTLKFALAIILLLIFAALAIPLKSYLQPVLIMSVIPFGIIGAILGHLITGLDVSMLSIVGIVGLIGVVVNDSLLMVDFINQHIDEGHGWQEAVNSAGTMRFRAVALTSLTTFLGLLPIQLETSIQAQFVKPMATSVAFGVLFATCVTLLLVPTLYVIGKDIQAAAFRLMGRNELPDEH